MCIGGNNVFKKNVALLNYHWENVNFGAVLTAYALNKYLNEDGYYARNINYYPSFPWIEGEEENPYFDEFRRKYIPMTEKLLYNNSLECCNDEFSSFIVGSDQVWRPEFINDERDAYFLTFAGVDKKVISYAASFGVDKIEGSEFDLQDYKYRLSLIDYVGVRENSAVQICNEFNVNATQVCDPVFLLNREHWEVLSETSNCDLENEEIVFYTINEKLEQEMIDLLECYKEKSGDVRIKNITYKLSVEEWLYRIKKCKFFLTDSFHGTCFAIIFNKPFVCINPNKKTQTRMEFLLESLNIKGRLYTSFDEVDLNSISDDEIEYEKVNELLKCIREEGIKFLKKH